MATAQTAASASQTRNDAMRKARAKQAEIGPPIYPDGPDDPPELNLEEFERHRYDLKGFCKAVFPEDFYMDWSKAHDDAAAKLEKAILEGGQFALAMPRGSGKSTLARAAAIWALCYGHRRYVCVVGAEANHADEIINAIKTEFESNDHLLRYFPHICWPIRQLDGVYQRTKSQTYNGEHTWISMSSSKLVLPTVNGEPASGSILYAAGITGRIRGQFHVPREGGTIRPDLVLIDDPQTDESAASPTMVEKREKIIRKAILKLAGPDVKIAATALVTVIRKYDLAHKLLDQEAWPEWQGQKTKLMPSMPDRMDLWEGEYDTLRREGLASGVGLELANKYYLDNHEEMVKGAVVSWEQRHHPDEIDAIQHAMNWCLSDQESFMSEGQQDPELEGEQLGITETAVYACIGKYRDTLAPMDTQKITCFIDVQERLLYWAAMAFRPGFSGLLMGYGSWPQQPDHYFTYSNVRFDLASKYKGGPDAQIVAALNDLITVLDKQWEVDEAGTLGTDLIGIDAGYRARQVREVIHKRKLQNLVHTYGRGVTAAQLPINEKLTKRPGDHAGNEWRLSWTLDQPRQRHILYDANYWKSFVASRINTELGDPGSFEIFEGSEIYHRMIAEQLSSETAVRTEGRGREVDQWSLLTARDNHLLDCVVGCHVLASRLGVQLKADLKGRGRRRKINLPGRE